MYSPSFFINPFISCDIDIIYFNLARTCNNSQYRDKNDNNNNNNINKLRTKSKPAANDLLSYDVRL